MFKTKLFASLTLICALVISVSARAADDDVFLDEGNGDFDQMPVVPSAPVAEEQSSTPPSPEQAPEPMPMLSEESPSEMSAPAAQEEVAPVKPAKKAKKEKVAKSEAPRAPKANKTARKSLGGGHFVVTKEACPMMRSPASTSETMLTVKPAKKIWVEEAEEGWVQGFNKAGEPGYISKSCLE